MAKEQKKDSGESTTEETSVTKVVADFQASWHYTASNYHQRWERAFSLYNNRRVNRSYIGITDTFVPMTFSTIETMAAALFGGKPKFEFDPPHDKADQNTDILNGLLNYFWDLDNWSIKVIKWGRGMLREGTSVVYFYWENDHICMLNIPIRDFFIDPTASDFATARYMGRRYLTTLGELESFEVVDMDKLDKNGQPTGEMKKKYKNLDQIGNGNRAGDETDKEKKDMFYGSTVDDADEHQIEVLEYWTDDKIISIANRDVEIENDDNYFKAAAKAKGDKYPKGIRPFAPMRDYTDESLFYARGEVDVIADEQELLNDVTNQRNDSLSFILNQMYTLDPKYAHLLEEIENIPGATYLAEKGALSPIEQRPVPAEAYTEAQNIKNEIRETTASSEIVKGTNQTQDTTATEVNTQVANAGQRMAIKITQIEDEAFHAMATIFTAFVKVYITEPMMVKIVGNTGIEWQEFDPKEFQGEYTPRVQLSTTVEQDKQRQAASAKEMYAAFMGDPTINQTELKSIVLSKGFDLEPDEVQKLMTPEGMGAPGMPVDPMAALAGGQPPQGMPQPGALPQLPTAPGMAMPSGAAPAAPPPKLPSESITYKDVVASGATDAAAAMLEQAGLPGDGMRAQAPAPGQVIAGKVQPPVAPPSAPAAVAVPAELGGLHPDIAALAHQMTHGGGNEA